MLLRIYSLRLCLVENAIRDKFGCMRKLGETEKAKMRIGSIF
jgi:hypothetical protein